MNREMYASLTPMERNCLRLAQHDRKAEQIAHALGIRPSTVNTHIFSARRKLGGIPRLTAADQLRNFEAEVNSGLNLPPPEHIEARQAEAAAGSRGTPQPLSRHSMSIDTTTPSASEKRHPAEVREPRAAFIFDDERDVVPGGQDVRSDEALRRLALILVIALLACLVLIAAPAIYDSAAQRLANSLERPHTN